MALIHDLRAFFGTLRPRRRTQLILLLALMLASALAEMVSLGAIVPFLAVLADPSLALQRPMVREVVAAIGLDDGADLRLYLTLTFAAAAIVAGLLRLVLIYATARLNYGIGHELGAEVYRRTLYQPYLVQVTRNSSQIIGGLSKIDNVVYAAFQILMTCSAILTSLLIVVMLILIDPWVATGTLITFGGIYGAITLFTRKRLDRNSRAISKAISERVQSAQEGLGGIRDVLLDHAQPVFARRFNRVDWSMRQAQASINFVGPSPRYVVEALGMVLIALLAYHLTTEGGGVASAIPTLGALALGAQRLMPLLQQIYQGWVYVAGHRQELTDVLELLRQPAAPESHAVIAPLPFDEDIQLDRMSFQYQPHLPPVLREVSLRIPKGMRIGFVGATGSGKSTVTDILMGLLQPTAGMILVDGCPVTSETRLAWQRNIAHVPQAIFLADASFAENIAFGVARDKIDMARVRDAARQAQIADFIDSGRQGYDALVGERGVRLSGGQRQRIGIARALYKQAKVLVFDEATSALDDGTEAAVMQAIDGLGRDLTIVLIAHRISTLQGCDIIYRMDQGRLVYSGSYRELLATSHS